MDLLSPAALALLLSLRETGELVTPYETAQLRAEAVAQHGFDGLRAEAFKRALFSSAAEPDVFCARVSWARAASFFDDRP